MNDGANLLRLLEPVVRPGNVPSPSCREHPPIESRDFESLLSEAQQNENVDSTNTTGGTAPAKAPDSQLLGKLSSVDQIANPDLLSILTRSAASGESAARTDPGDNQ